MGGTAQGSLQIVRDHHDGDSVLPIEVGNQLIHLRRDLRIEARDGFIEEEQLSCGAERPGKQGPLLLSAGQLPVAAPGQRLDLHAADVLPRERLVLRSVEGAKPLPSLTAGEDNLIDAGREVPLHHGLLRQIANLVLPQAIAGQDAALQRVHQAQDRFHQRGFAGAVFAHDAEVFPRLDFKADMLQNWLSLVAEGEVFAGQKRHCKRPLM